MNYKRQKKITKIIFVILIICMVFTVFDFIASEITDKYAYEDASVNTTEWTSVYAKLIINETLTDEDYETIFEQSGLGKPAVDALIGENRISDIGYYRDYYLKDKAFTCVRTAIFAKHEAVTDNTGKRLLNPDFANIENGDIIVTLSIHSLGWRHGHAAIVTDAETGETAQAVRIFEKSDFGTVWEWNEFPLVAVLRVKDIDEATRNEIANYVRENMIGIPYALSAGVIGGRNTEAKLITTQCAHYVWYAYKCFGIDLDTDGGFVTPKELLQSEELEIVQVYGNIMDL